MTQQLKHPVRASDVPDRLDNDYVHIDRGGARVLAEVAHEMRQPLTAALAALHSIRITSNDRFRQHAYVILDRQFQRLSHLLDDHPTEIHAFASRYVPISVYVVTTSNQAIWTVERGVIRYAQQVEE